MNKHLSNFKSLRLHGVMIATYLFFIVGLVLVNSFRYETPLLIDLNDSRVYVREGVERNYLVSQETLDSQWVNLTGRSWRIYDSGLVDAEKQPMFTLTDKQPKYYSYMMEFDVSTEQIAYLRRNSICPGLFLASISDNWEIYLNGNLIKRNIHLDADGNITQHKNETAYSVPFDKSYLLEGANRMTIYIVCSPNYQDSGLYFRGEYYIDEYEGIQAQSNNLFLILFSGISIFMAFYNLLIFINSAKEHYYFHFACVQFLLGIYIFMNTQYVQFFFANTKDVKTIEFMCVSIMPIFAILFCKAIARERLRLIWKIIIGLQALIAVMMPFVGQQASIDLLMLAECLVLVDLVYALVVAVRDLYRHAKEHQRITGAGMLREFGSVTLRSVLGNTAIGLVIVLISAAIGVLYSTIIMADQNHIIIGLFAFIISVSYALSNDVIETKHQIAGQNELLEVKVLERTKELEEQTELAVLASETKTRFLATMSHEIRTPMNAIIGISQIELGRNDLDQHTKEALRRIYHSGRGLLGIINDILDLSKAETGSLELVPTEYYFASVLNDVVQLNMVRIAAKPIKFLLEVDPNIPAKLVGDELRLKQICSNILSNAFKYTDEGHVWMQVRLLTQGDRHELFIQVTDTGQGMHKEDADKLFDEYTRFNKSANRTTEGTGLGMSITGRLIKLMQGRIQVDSEFGKGSTFSIWIPQECEDTTPIGEEMARQLGSFQYQDREKEDDVLTLESMPYGKILLVDDVETNLYVAEGLLAPYNLSIERALSGFEAINAVTAGKEYDIIFMDHMMPRMDGVETVRRIRQMGYEGPIVALTANAIAGNDNFFRQNGFDDFVSKPINMKQMDAILHRWIKDRHPEEAAAVGASNMAMQADSSDAAAVRDGALQADTMQQIDTAQPMNAAKKALLEVFARDANQAIQVLGDTYLNGDLPLFAITAHGMKSACLNVGEDVLSNMALQLEKAAKVQDKEQIDQLLPVFLEKLTKRIEEWIVSSAPGPTTEDTKLLREKLHEIRNACESYDEMSANAAIRQLEACSWSQETQELIRTLAGCLLHTDFEEAAQTCEKELQKR